MKTFILVVNDNDQIVAHKAYTKKDYMEIVYAILGAYDERKQSTYFACINETFSPWYKTEKVTISAKIYQ